MTSTPHQPTAKDFRSFGLLMGGVFLIVAIWPLVIHEESIQVWASLIAGVFGSMGMLFPKGLAPVYRVWMRIGEKLGWINSRILLSLLFFGMFTPMGLVMRLLGKRPIQPGYDPKASTYRILKKARAADHVLKPF